MSAERGRGSRVIWVVLLLVFALLLILQDSPERPYDLRSAGPTGWKGLALLLEETGTPIERVDASEVDVASLAKYGTVLVPVPDGASARTIRRWRAYAEGGGRLVLGLGSRQLGAPPAPVDEQATVFGIGLAGFGERKPGRCTIAALAVDGLRPMRFFPDTRELRVRGRAGCYGTERRALVASTPTGLGEIVNLASPDLLTNELLGAPAVGTTTVTRLPDNGLVAQLLLGQGPTAGAPRRLAVVTSGVAAAPEGDKDLTDFLPLGVKIGLLQIAVAFGVYAVARGRRHGRVVEEPVPVSLAGSSFTEAVGDLLERQGSHERAAAVLRRARCRELCERLGLPLDTDPVRLAALLAERTGRDADQLVAVLTGAVVDDDDLVELCRSLDSIRQEALHV